MTWTTVSDVNDLLGETVTTQKVARANTDITVYAARMPSASAGMNDRDLYWLKLAASYQAVWLTGQVEVETRQSVRSQSTDGASVDYGDQEWKVVLGPLAARSLRNLSWKSTRTERPGFSDLVVADGFLRESLDERSDWQPLEGG